MYRFTLERFAAILRIGHECAPFSRSLLVWIFGYSDPLSAAGNYVELHGSFGTELARRTMADLEAELAPQGFVRVHRSRLVRRAAIATIVTRQSGDFDITLRSGTVISGSRRFRENLG